MSNDSKIGLKKFPPKAAGPGSTDDHVHEDELAISAAVYTDPADELAEMRERYADLVAECVSLTATAEQRLVLAARIAEIDMVLDAPDAARRAVAMRPQGTDMMTRSY